MTTTSTTTTTYNPILGDEDYCTTENPCGIDQGDCDFNNECQTNLLCGPKNCPTSLGFDLEVDCCISNQIMSPNYPNSYPSNSQETWLITAPIGSTIHLQFHSFQVRTKNFVDFRNIKTYKYYFLFSNYFSD